MKVGTFSICGTKKTGYWIVDRDTFNNWGIKANDNGKEFKTRREAAEFAKRCHEFKIGRRLTV